MASDKNEVMVTGNLVRDPEIRTTPSGMTVGNFSIASNRFKKNGDEFEKQTSFFDIQCWTNTADYVAMNIHKGDSVEVIGRLEQQRWTSNGQNRSKIVIVANSVYKQERYAKTQIQPQNEECPF